MASHAAGNRALSSLVAGRRVSKPAHLPDIGQPAEYFPCMLYSIYGVGRRDIPRKKSSAGNLTCFHKTGQQHGTDEIK